MPSLSRYWQSRNSVFGRKCTWAWFVDTLELQVLHEIYPYTFTVSLMVTVQCINKQIKFDLRSISWFVSYCKAYLIWNNLHGFLVMLKATLSLFWYCQSGNSVFGAAWSECGSLELTPARDTGNNGWSRFFYCKRNRACPTEQSLKRELLKALIPSGIKEPKRANLIE